MRRSTMRLVLLLQLMGTFAVLALPIPNVARVALLPVWWWLTFDGLSRRELALFVGAGVLFTTMDVVAVHNRVFLFDHPDALGIPVWEPLMFGFYLLHTHRMLDGPPARDRTAASVVFTVCFAVPFLVPLHWLGHAGLFAVTAAILGVGLLLFRDRWDLAYTIYLVALGMVLEQIGTRAGQWHYEGTGGAVPPWSITMFGGIGVAFRRVVLRLIVPESREENVDVRNRPTVRLDGAARGPRSLPSAANARARLRDERPRPGRGLPRARGA